MTTIDTSSAVFKDTIMAYGSARDAERLVGIGLPSHYDPMTEDHGI